MCEELGLRTQPAGHHARFDSYHCCLTAARRRLPAHLCRGADPADLARGDLVRRRGRPERIERIVREHVVGGTPIEGVVILQAPLRFAMPAASSRCSLTHLLASTPLQHTREPSILRCRPRVRRYAWKRCGRRRREQRLAAQEALPWRNATARAAGHPGSSRPEPQELAAGELWACFVLSSGRAHRLANSSSCGSGLGGAVVGRLRRSPARAVIRASKSSDAAHVGQPAASAGADAMGIRQGSGGAGPAPTPSYALLAQLRLRVARPADRCGAAADRGGLLITTPNPAALPGVGGTRTAFEQDRLPVGKNPPREQGPAAPPSCPGERPGRLQRSAVAVGRRRLGPGPRPAPAPRRSAQHAKASCAAPWQAAHPGGLARSSQPIAAAHQRPGSAAAAADHGRASSLLPLRSRSRGGLSLESAHTGGAQP